MRDNAGAAALMRAGVNALVAMIRDGFYYGRRIDPEGEGRVRERKREA